MPLITNSLLQARSLYSDLELRAQSSEANVAILQATVGHLASVHQDLVQQIRTQGDFTSQQIVTNAQLTANQATAVSPDLTLNNFIAALGLSIALAEATMPDRTINNVSATVQSFLTFNTGPDGVTKVPGLRLYQPELGASTALATTSFDIAKIGVAPGSPAPRSLYAVLQEKQSLFAAASWSKLTAGTPPVAPAQQIVAEIVKIFVSIGSWSFPYLLQEASMIAGLETALATSLATVGQSAAATAFTAAVAGLTGLTTAIGTRANHVAGDLYALTAALDTTTRRAAAAEPGVP